jgi:hypothetical protein
MKARRKKKDGRGWYVARRIEEVRVWNEVRSKAEV